MKYFIFAILVGFQSVHGESVSSSFNETQTSLAKGRPFKAREFFELLTPESKKDPLWPSELAIADPKMSLSTFKKSLPGIWRQVCHFNGAPIKASDKTPHGKLNDYIEVLIDKKTLSILLLL